MYPDFNFFLFLTKKVPSLNCLRKWKYIYIIEELIYRFNPLYLAIFQAISLCYPHRSWVWKWFLKYQCSFCFINLNLQYILKNDWSLKKRAFKSYQLNTILTIITITAYYIINVYRSLGRIYTRLWSQS